MSFDKEALRQYMKEKGLTQNDLAALTKRDVRTIRRWLSPKHRLTAKSIDQICTALAVDPEKFDPNWQESNSSKQTVQIGARVSATSANYYLLLKKQYGVTQKEIVELAPAIFAIIARRALGTAEQLEKRVQLAESLLDEVCDIGNHSQIDVYGELERTIIQARHATDKMAIFGTDEAQDDNDQYFQFTNNNNLFARELNSLCKNFECSSPFGTSPTTLNCIGSELPISLLEEICCGDQSIKRGIVRGDINLSRMDDSLWLPENKRQRLEWLSDEYNSSRDLRALTEAAWRKTNPKLAKKLDKIMTTLGVDEAERNQEKDDG